MSSEELAIYQANYNINTVNNGAGMVKIVAANVNFRTDYKMRYSFTVNGIDTEKVTGYGVIVSEDAAGQSVVSKHEYQGKLADDPNKAGRYLVTYMVDAADITKDLYVTVYVKYTDGENEVTEQSQTMQYGLYKFLTRSIYKYSPAGGGAKVTGDTDGTKTAQYVAMLNSLLKFGEKYDQAS